MNERKYRILILVIGSIMVLSIFLPKLLRAERSERVLNVTLTGGEEITSVSSKNSEIKHTRVNTTAVKIVTTKTTTTTSSKIDKKEETTEFLFLDINSASAEELEKLKGIGPVLAKAIVDYRSENGGFRNIDELLLVSGIGESIFLTSDLMFSLLILSGLMKRVMNRLISQKKIQRSPMLSHPKLTKIPVQKNQKQSLLPRSFLLI